MAVRPSKSRAPAGVLLGPWLVVLGVLGVLAGLFFGQVASGAAAGAASRRPVVAAAHRPAIRPGAGVDVRDGRQRGGQVAWSEPASRGEALAAAGGGPMPAASEPSVRRPGLARARELRPIFARETGKLLPLRWSASALALTLYPEGGSGLAGASPPASHEQAARREPQERDVHAPRGPPPAPRATSGDRRRA